MHARAIESSPAPSAAGRRPLERPTRRALGAALLAAAVLGMPAARATAADLCGDADGNGSVTVTDGVQTLRGAVGLPSTCTPARCDMDGGGTITVTDGVNVLRTAGGLPTTRACPGTGPEPTPGGTCVAATVTVTLTAPSPVGAARLVLAYPAAAVALPGSGDAAAARFTRLTSTSLFGDGRPNDLDDHVLVSLVAPAGLGSGDVFALRFDCLGTTPAAAAFGCTLEGVVGTDGATAVGGAGCSVRVAAE